MKKVLSLLLLICMLLIFCACEKKNPFTGNPEAIKTGAELYRTHCERCHGPEGSGGVCPNLTDKDWKYGGTDRDVFRSIASGREGGMPAWKNILTGDEIWKIIAYIRTLEKDDDICRFEKGPCVKKLGSSKVILYAEPAPIQAFKETTFILHIRDSELPEQVILDLSMPEMFMGKNEVVLKRTEGNKYKGTGVIPRCPSGKTLWQAEVLMPGKEKVVFRFNVK